VQTNETERERGQNYYWTGVWKPRRKGPGPLAKYSRDYAV